jgi:hypothetical protein
MIDREAEPGVQKSRNLHMRTASQKREFLRDHRQGSAARQKKWRKHFSKLILD